MDCIKLQHQADALKHLLPIQHDWFNRLLFQLSFNDIELIQTLGATGSGKSTLALALAELLSEQFNVALLTATADLSSTASIQQQWFGEVFADSDLAAHVVEYSKSQALCLIIDDGQNLNPELLQQIIALPIRCFVFATKAVTPAGLTLTINQATLVDAQQLLASQQLSTEQLALGLQQANGNLHSLLNIGSTTTLAKASKAAHSKPINRKLLALVICIALIAIIALVTNYIFINQTDLTNQGSDLVQPKQSFPALSQPLEAELIENNSDLTSEAIIETEVTAKPEESAEEVIVNDNITSTAVDVEAKLETHSEPVLATNPSSELAQPPLKSITDLEASEPSIPTKLLQKCDSGVLLAADKNDAVLQLAVLSNITAFERLQGRYPELTMYCYQRSWQGQAQFVIVLGPFPDNKLARNAKSRLPGKLATSGSFIKSIKAVQAEIDAFAVSQHLSVEE